MSAKGEQMVLTTVWVETDAHCAATANDASHLARIKASKTTSCVDTKKHFINGAMHG